MSSASKKQLDDKHQKILRKLLQLPENKKCFDCSEKGPFYACTTLGTFVCTTCSGIHREFQHHVKSISMASFKPEEVQFLEQMGNGRAREIWLAYWTPSEYPEPDSTDKARVREFMKLKYERKKWFARPGSAKGDTNGSSHTSEKKSRKKRNEDTPKVEPIETILGKDIPPISITHHIPLNAIKKDNGQPARTNTVPQQDPLLVNWGQPVAAAPAPTPVRAPTAPFPGPTSAVSAPLPAGGQAPSTGSSSVLSGLESVFTQPEPAKPPSTVWPPPPAGVTAPMSAGAPAMGAFPPYGVQPFQQVSPQVFQQMTPQQQQQYLLMQQQWIQQQQLLLQQRMAHMTLAGAPPGAVMTPMGPAAGVPGGGAVGVMGTNPFLVGPTGSPAVLAPYGSSGSPALAKSGAPAINDKNDPFADLSPLPPKPAGSSTATAPSGPAPSRGPGIGMGASASPAQSPFFPSAPAPSSPALSPALSPAPSLAFSQPGSNPFASPSGPFMQPSGGFPSTGAGPSAPSSTGAPSSGAGFNPFSLI